MLFHSQIARTRRRSLCAVARRNVLIRSDRPLISFSFDDFPRTALTVGGSILRDAGVHGTYYVAAGLVNTLNALGPQFREEDLRELLAAGHELASHTYSHTSARNTGFARYVREVEKGYQTLVETFGLNASRQFAYPYGELTLRVKLTVGQTMQSCRGIWPGLNGPGVDLSLLYANSLYGDTNQLAPLKALIDENNRRQSWLIFYTHDVQRTPSAYGCTPALLEQVVRAAAKSGARIATVAEVIALATADRLVPEMC
jgi:peptidoglycan/xylan/chitin deacetylase (PgdA/CDA1 family)